MGELTAEEVERRSRLTMAALAAAMDEDKAGVNDALNTLAEAGWGALFGAALGFGTAISAAHKIPKDKPGGIVVIDAATGKQGSLEDVGLGPELNAALRIFAAWQSGDVDMAYAIFSDAVERGAGHDVVAAALAVAALVLNTEYERRKAAES